MWIFNPLELVNITLRRSRAHLVCLVFRQLSQHGGVYVINTEHTVLLHGSLFRYYVVFKLQELLLLEDEGRVCEVYLVDCEVATFLQVSQHLEEIIAF